MRKVLLFALFYFFFVDLSAMEEKKKYNLPPEIWSEIAYFFVGEDTHENILILLCLCGNSNKMIMDESTSGNKLFPRLYQYLKKYKIYKINHDAIKFMHKVFFKGEKIKSALIKRIIMKKQTPEYLCATIRIGIIFPEIAPDKIPETVDDFHAFFAKMIVDESLDISDCSLSINDEDIEKVLKVSVEKCDFDVSLFILKHFYLCWLKIAQDDDKRNGTDTYSVKRVEYSKFFTEILCKALRYRCDPLRVFILANRSHFKGW